MKPTDGNPELFVVDDDPAMRDLWFEMFTQAHYQVTRFVDGASFVAVARQRTPACIILDIHMPGRSGLDILKDIDAPNYPAPIFIASGRGDIPTAVQAIKSGAFDFFEKQSGSNTLVTRVNVAVDLWATAQTRRRPGQPTASVISGPRASDPARARRAGTDRRRRHQQGGGSQPQHQPAHR